MEDNRNSVWQKFVKRFRGDAIGEPRNTLINLSKNKSKMFNRKVFIRIIEVILCFACLTTLRITDDESSRVYHYLRNRSREWSLLNNVTWGRIGAAFATATCGGYVIITVGLLIATMTGELSGRWTESFLLGVGVILFAVIGGLALTSIDGVPDQLVDNATIFGSLCLITAFIFIIDLLMTTPKAKKHDDNMNILYNDTVKPVTTITTTMTMEKEEKISKNNNDNTQNLEADKSGNIIFDKVNKPEVVNVPDTLPSESSLNDKKKKTTIDVGVTAEPIDFHDRDIKFIDAERQTKDYINRRHDSYVDTPRFPTTKDNIIEPVFPKFINPSVKIMRVDRYDDDDDNDHFETRGRFSDLSQYDNVPTRIAPGILKRGYNMSSINNNKRAVGRGRDEIEKLEEWVGVLRKSTTGTQTGPSSPTDPGYVRHTASNWPRDIETHLAN
ncbi:uncharacterized protein LOC122852874 isoform X2 [Aphidius gifuensis]|nr:uncharacterized protein LOC122852874 isoform X2 [Aphidius gifuensis]